MKAHDDGFGREIQENDLDIIPKRYWRIKYTATDQIEWHSNCLG